MFGFLNGSSDLLFLHFSICSNISSLAPQYVDRSQQRICSHLSIHILNTLWKITHVSSSCIKLTCKIKTKMGNKEKVYMLTGRKYSFHMDVSSSNIRLKQRKRGLDSFFSYANGLLHGKGQNYLWCYSYFWV